MSNGVAGEQFPRSWSLTLMPEACVVGEHGTIPVEVSQIPI